ncbi:MAG: hypothetical protein ACLR8P_08580 [Clostridium fessum]
MAGVINAALNIFFVTQLQMDVAGVALATVISQCISAFLVIRCLIAIQRARCSCRFPGWESTGENSFLL